jgi:hypothetical protein
MKKILILALALFLIVGLVPMTAMAEATAADVRFTNPEKAEFTVSVQPGATAYVTTNDELKFVEHKEAEAPTDKFVKMELSADGSTLNVTFKNINVNSCDTGYKLPAVEFKAGSYAVVLEVIGDNYIVEQRSVCIKNDNDGGMTITGEGTLNLSMSTSDDVKGAADGIIHANGGNLVIQNAKLNLRAYTTGNSWYHGILAAKGNVSIKNSKIDSEIRSGGQLIFMGLGSSDKPRSKLDPDTNRFVTIEDSEIISVANMASFKSATPISITNSTITGKKTGANEDADKAIFVPAPEFKGEYTAIAGLLKNADKPEKLKVFEPKKLSSYTYFHMVPGIVELLPTTEPTEPETVPTEPETVPTEPTTVPTEPTTVPTQPEAPQPEATQPEATQPKATQPEATQPEATQPTDNAEEGGSPLKVVVIVIAVLVVLAGGGVAALFILKKKGIIK